MPVTTADIGDLIQTTIQRLLVTPLEEASSFLSSGVRIFDTASPISIPKLEGAFAPGWVGESQLIPEDDGAAFSAVTLLPSTLRSVKTLIRLSNESLRQSTLSLDSVLQDRLTRDVATKIDAQAWSALGDGTLTPRGIFHASNVADFLKVDAGTSVTLDHLHDAVGAALAGNVPLSGLRWVMPPALLTKLRKIKDTSGKYVVEPDVTVANGLRLLGIAVNVTGRFTGERALLWSPNTWAVARDLSPTAVVDRSRYLEYDEVALRIVCRFDWACLQPEANVYLYDAP